MTSAGSQIYAAKRLKEADIFIDKLKIGKVKSGAHSKPEKVKSINSMLILHFFNGHTY